MIYSIMRGYVLNYEIRRLKAQMQGYKCKAISGLGSDERTSALARYYVNARIVESLEQLLGENKRG